MNTPTLDRASLNDPLYYLHNARTVLQWVLTHHGDLLHPDEARQLEALLQLPTQAQALLMRMVMRKGELFRTSKLNYSEVTDMPAAAQALAEARFLELRPEITLSELCQLLTKAELVQLCQYQLPDIAVPRAAVKEQIIDILRPLAHPDEDVEPASARRMTYQGWWPEANDQLWQLSCMALFDLVRLLFFGNLRQDWSEFVLTELGHQRYERVDFTPSSRAFQTRQQVDIYLHLHQCREQLESSEVVLAELLESVPAALDNPWLESRRARLLFSIGRQAEREQQQALALRCYEQSGHREAAIRTLRLLEKSATPMEVYQRAEAALQSANHADEQVYLYRILKRVAKKAGQPLRLPPTPADIPLQYISVPYPTGSTVELASAAYFHHQGQQQGTSTRAFYVENTLFNGLFALLCWPALFAPLPGAFFHPFQSAAADLLRDDFVSRRQALFDECLHKLDDGSYQQQIQHYWQLKQGITTPFTYWPALEQPLLQLALQHLPAAQLKAIFLRLLQDIKQHRSGFPDLICFDADGHVRLIEVKGPGDRLQDHQRLWLEYFIELGMDVSVCHVSWLDNSNATPDEPALC